MRPAACATKLGLVFALEIKTNPSPAWWHSYLNASGTTSRMLTVRPMLNTPMRPVA